MPSMYTPAVKEDWAISEVSPQWRERGTQFSSTGSQRSKLPRLGHGWADRNQMGIPVTAGQSEISRAGCRDLMMSGAIDVCNFDASWGGGPTPWLRVAKAAACFGIEMAHHGEPIVGSHLLAAVENGTYAETHHPTRDPIFHQMVEGRGKIADGYYTMPCGPGWGVSYDPDFIARYQAQ